MTVLRALHFPSLIPGPQALAMTYVVITYIDQDRSTKIFRYMYDEIPPKK